MPLTKEEDAITFSIWMEFYQDSLMEGRKKWGQHTKIII
jgi:hypothetical protein